MPLEMFDGKTGQRLIARLPVIDGSYAVVQTENVPALAIVHLRGLMFNGYPALSPLVDSAPDIVAPMEQRRAELETKFSEAFGRLQKSKEEVSQVVANDLGAAIGLGCARAMLNLNEAILAHAYPQVKKAIICTSVMIGRQLSLKLPKGMFTDVSTIELGVVRSISIHNK